MGSTNRTMLEALARRRGKDNTRGVSTSGTTPGVSPPGLCVDVLAMAPCVHQASCERSRALLPPHCAAEQFIRFVALYICVYTWEWRALTPGPASLSPGSPEAGVQCPQTPESTP